MSVRLAGALRDGDDGSSSSVLPVLVGGGMALAALWIVGFFLTANTVAKSSGKILPKILPFMGA